jgi:3-keto-5-aminohexanoate cleavage enzyme
MKPDLLSTEKVIITAAITGGIHDRSANPALPVTPEQQAQDALDCYNAGAAIVHIQARDSEGQSSGDVDLYSHILTLIDEKCPIIRQIGNGIGIRMDNDNRIVMPSLEDRYNLLTINPQAEMHTIKAGTFEFRTPYGATTFYNPVSFNEAYIQGCKVQNIGVEIEIYDFSHIANVKEMLEKGTLTLPLHISLVLGIRGGAPASSRVMLNMIDALPEGSTWQVIAVGRHHLRTTLMAIMLGGNARTGLEDTLFYKGSEPAESNAQLVERMVRLAREVGREPATVEEAKTILGLTR